MSLSSNKKIKVWKRDRFICHYCGENLRWEFENNYPSDTCRITVDHKIPKHLHLKDKNSFDNLITACRACNQEKDKKEAPVKMVIYRK